MGNWTPAEKGYFPIGSNETIQIGDKMAIGSDMTSIHPESLFIGKTPATCGIVVLRYDEKRHAAQRTPPVNPDGTPKRRFP